MQRLGSEKWDEIANLLAKDGAVVLPEFFPTELCESVREEIADGRQSFREAAIGKGAANGLHPEIRSDRTLWWDFERPTPVQERFREFFQRTREELNRRLYLGLWDIEGHYAIYPPGAFYRRHLDRFKNDSARTVSLVVFFNADWEADHGGELQLEIAGESGGELRRVRPEAGTLVIFLSDRIPHEVLPTRRERLSFAGWFRTR